MLFLSSFEIDGCSYHGLSSEAFRWNLALPGWVLVGLPSSSKRTSLSLGSIEQDSVVDDNGTRFKLLNRLSNSKSDIVELVLVYSGLNGDAEVAMGVIMF